MDSARTVLIVDDERLLVETIAFNLGRAGFLVFKAFDGESALQIALEGKPALLILDVMLPQLSGWDVCRALKSAPDGDQTPRVLMLTARGEAADQRKSYDAGADDVLLKPFAMGELVRRVEGLLGG